MVEITSGKLRKGDLLLFNASVAGGKATSNICESVTFWAGQAYEKIKDLPLFVSAWRGKCGCWFFQYEQENGKWRVSCLHCGKDGTWEDDKGKAKKAFHSS